MTILSANISLLVHQIGIAYVLRIDEINNFHCSYDYLKIADENNVTIGKYCGQQTGNEVAIGGDYAVLTLRANKYNQRRGFRLFFTAGQPGKSNRNATFNSFGSRH